MHYFMASACAYGICGNPTESKFLSTKLIIKNSDINTVSGHKMTARLCV